MLCSGSPRLQRKKPSYEFSNIVDMIANAATNDLHVIVCRILMSILGVTAGMADVFVVWTQKQARKRKLSITKGKPFILAEKLKTRQSETGGKTKLT